MTDVVNVGSAVNDGTGDQLRTAFQKINARFDVLDVATQAEAEAGTDNAKRMTPLRAKEAIENGLRSVLAGVTGAVNRSIVGKLLDIPLTPEDFGADPTGAANSNTAFANWLAAMISQRRKGKLRGGFYAITSQIAVTLASSDRLTIEGEGHGPSVILTSVDGPTFKFTFSTAGSSVDYWDWKGFQFYGNYSAGSTGYNNSACIEFAGTGASSFVQNSNFDFTVIGIHTGIKVTKDGTNTGSYDEGAFNWMKVKMRCSPLGATPVNPVIYAVKLEKGSGTGNSFEFAGAVSDAWLYVDGATHACGDILIRGHMGGHNSTVALKCNAAASYRDLWDFSGAQFDAGMVGAFSITAAGTSPARGIHVGSNVGGGVDIYASAGATIRQSNIKDRGYDEWGGGVLVETGATGAITPAAIRVDLADYDATDFEIAVSGFVGGVDSGIRTKRWHLIRRTGTVQLDLKQDYKTAGDGTTTVSGSFWDITTSVSGTTALFTLAGTPGATGSYADVQFRAKGGRKRVRRTS